MRKYLAPILPKIRCVRSGSPDTILGEDYSAIWLMAYVWPVELSRQANFAAESVEPDMPGEVIRSNWALFVERDGEQMRAVFALLSVLERRELLVTNLGWYLRCHDIPDHDIAARLIVERAQRDVVRMIGECQPLVA